MGMFRDRESDLSDLQRLIAKISEPGRRAELSPGEWPQAMVAYALQLSDDPALLGPEMQAAYADFVSNCTPRTRLAAIAQLAGFVRMRRGGGWRALLPAALGESADAAVCVYAATQVLTLAPPSEDERFTGAAALVHHLLKPAAPSAMLTALLSTADLRLLPLLEPLSHRPQAHLQALLDTLPAATPLTSLASAWLLHLAEAEAAPIESIAAAFARMAACTPLVADLVYPIPAWAYENSTPQPLHAWSREDFLPRILPQLAPRLTPARLATLRSAFCV